MAVIGSSAYVVDGTQIVRVDTGTGAPTTVAGVVGSGTCQNGSDGSQARFAANNGGVAGWPAPTAATCM